MSSVDAIQDQAVLWTLDFDAELPCEATHNAPSNKTCSGRSVAHQQSCAVDWVICENQLAYAKRAIASGSWHTVCKRPCAECWSIRPI